MTILSCGIVPEDAMQLPPHWRKWTDWADCVYGSAKLLALSPELQAKSITLGADARQKAQEALEASRQGEKILLLASGDSLFHGIGSTIRELAQKEDELIFLPAETAFQTLFHRLGLPWDTARFFSAHFSSNIPLGDILSCPLAVIYGGTRLTASGLAQLCIDFLPACSGRNAVLAENLGTSGERILTASLAALAKEESSPTSILLLLPSDDARLSPILPLGCSNAQYAKENNLITGEEVRAIVLSKLRLPSWGTLWDIGAGSGSIGLEAAALRPELQVFSLEKDEFRISLIQTNKERMSLPNYSLYTGSAPGALADLPQPDRIFIGGGGEDLGAILDTCFSVLAPGGVIAATSVTLESALTLRSWHPERRIGCWEIDIAEENTLAGKYHHFRPQHRITLVTFSKP